MTREIFCDLDKCGYNKDGKCTKKMLKLKSGFCNVVYSIVNGNIVENPNKVFDKERVTDVIEDGTWRVSE